MSEPQQDFPFHEVAHVLAKSLVDLEEEVGTLKGHWIRLDERLAGMIGKLEELQKAFYRRAIFSGGATGGLLYALVELARNFLE